MNTKMPMLFLVGTFMGCGAATMVDAGGSKDSGQASDAGRDADASTPFILCGTSAASVVDTEADVALGHVDVTSTTIAVDGQNVSITFSLRELPQQLEFCRQGVLQDRLEYSWEISIDNDNNTQTGSSVGGMVGADYGIQASYFCSAATPFTDTIANTVQADLTVLDGNTATVTGPAQLTVDTSANTITLSGEISGLRNDAAFTFSTFDANPSGSASSDWCD